MANPGGRAGGRLSALGRLRVPNTRTGAAMLAGGLAILGFTVGIALLVIVPMAAAGKGIFGVLGRGSRALPARAIQVGPASTPQDPRPELWQTPVASLAFPSEAAFAQLSLGQNTSGNVYWPPAHLLVLTLGPIADTRTGKSVSGVASFGPEDDPTTPGPFRPDDLEPTQLTIVATPAGTTEFGACALVIGENGIEAVAVSGSAVLEDCRDGTIRLPGGGSVRFAARTDVLPNHRSRDGTWREGGVFGRTEVRLGA